MKKIKPTLLKKFLNLNFKTACIALVTIMILHVITLFTPVGEHKSLRLKSDIIHNCKIGWFSEKGMCTDYSEYIVKQEGGEEEKNICGPDLKACEVKGVADYYYYTVLILEFFMAFYIGKGMGEIYKADVTPATKRKCLITYLVWNVIILGLIYAGNTFILFPGDIMRQVVEFIAFWFMFKMNGPVIPKKKKK